MARSRPTSEDQARITALAVEVEQASDLRKTTDQDKSPRTSRCVRTSWRISGREFENTTCTCEETGLPAGCVVKERSAHCARRTFSRARPPFRSSLKVGRCCHVDLGAQDSSVVDSKSVEPKQVMSIGRREPCMSLAQTDWAPRCRAPFTFFRGKPAAATLVYQPRLTDHQSISGPKRVCPRIGPTRLISDKALGLTSNPPFP